MGNISLARLDEKMDPESASSLSDAEKAVVRARDLTQQLLTFAKGGAPIRTAVDLPGLVREVAAFAVRGSQSRCLFDIPGDLWPADSTRADRPGRPEHRDQRHQAMSTGGTIDIACKMTWSAPNSPMCSRPAAM